MTIQKQFIKSDGVTQKKKAGQKQQKDRCSASSKSCHYCKTPGYLTTDCRQLKAKEAAQVDQSRDRAVAACKCCDLSNVVGSVEVAVPSGSPLKTRCSRPYKIVKQLNNLDYVIETPDRRKRQQVCHVNMLKPFYERDVESKSVNAAMPVENKLDEEENQEDSKLSSSINSDYEVDNFCTEPIVTGLLPDFDEIFSDNQGALLL
ncbi:Hypothetical predicted protein [Octopus vulgaris]|uniref:Integrase p58-like C-terminal domain-containing protein n=1 Tax=Octopus vulgaris TaxID=6645 RepID=A0AA36AJ88_OCTVU|nr:Hypothetical predicted protein [Octopus vulgaris]